MWTGHIVIAGLYLVLFSNPRSTPECIDYVILDMHDVISLPSLLTSFTTLALEFSRKSGITGGEGDCPS